MGVPIAIAIIIFLAGQYYGHQTLNPSNQCQWCDLHDGTARANGGWSNRPSVPCNDGNKCTKQDTCKAGRYITLSALHMHSYFVHLNDDWFQYNSNLIFKILICHL